MKRGHILYAVSSVASFLALASPIWAEDPSLRTGKASIREVTDQESSAVFRDSELQFDGFGLGDFYRGANGNFLDGPGTSTRQLSGRPSWGGGLAINYFFARFFGVGLEQSLYGRNAASRSDFGDYGMMRWATIGNVFFRYPIDRLNLAPYAMIGGGANYGACPDFTPRSAGGRRYVMAGQGFGHVGGGLEYRFTENVGVFSDARYLFSSVNGLPAAQLMWRYGVRVAF
jgi:hypothetical protein